MKTTVTRTGLVFLMCSISAFLTGCAAFRASTTDLDVNKTQHVRSTYDFSDLRTLSQAVADELLASPFLGDKSPAPIMMIAGVQNRTGRYVDTKGLTDKMRTLLFQSGKVQFVNEARREDLLKEQGYQAANATPETQTAVGKQLGAKYMLSGSLIEMQETSPRQVRVSKQEYTYYKLTMEVTDLESGLLAWTTEKEFARQSSQPLIGW